MLAAASVALVAGVLSAPAAQANSKGDIRITKVVVNHGKDVVVGTSGRFTYPIAVTVKDDHGVKGLTRVSTFSKDHLLGFAAWTGTSCKETSATTSVCTATMTIDPAWAPALTDKVNRLAGVWVVNADAKAKDGDFWEGDGIASYKVKRASRLTIDATPQQVAKNGTLTVKGKLTRANWETLKNPGFAGQAVRLQFKKAGTSSYSTVKTVTTDSAGRLSAKVKITASGTWRWSFSGTTTTAARSSTGNSVKLK
ncbi:hypothetical protein [Streptomyces sp. NPDC056821]|uniref:hypothetical protein n=1 Tax=unclassified Streptomyces TaxID=2593676 RepID=UPI0036C07EDD